MRKSLSLYLTLSDIAKHFLLVLAVVLLWPLTVVPTAAQPSSNRYFTVNTLTLRDGTSINEVIINGPPVPPPGFQVQRRAVSPPEPNKAAGVNILTAPAFNWVFGCSAVSGAMVAGYYDRSGWPNMYNGPTDGGVMPLDNSLWPTWSDGSVIFPSCPLIASMNGLDSRMTPGSIDDYWVQYDSPTADPYITGGWTQHTWGDAIGDYMKTSQSAYGNTDGATSFWGYADATKLYCADMQNFGIDNDGTQGRKLFYEARGYTVTECYNQNTDNMASGGFSFAQYKAEIDAGRPVMLNLAGHTIVGVGYDDASNLAYIHDTWDYSIHTMTWGTSYAGLDLYSVSIVNLVEATYTVRFNSNGGSTVPDQLITYNGKATRPADPTRTGYNFAGWYSDSGLTTEFNFETPITSDITLYAKWTVLSTYTVTYNGNRNTGGSAPVDPNSPYLSGSTVTVLGAGTLKRTGCTFAGWNTAANGSGTNYSAGATFAIAANTTLYAQWGSLRTYAVTYNGNGNTGGSAPVDRNSPYTSGKTVTVLDAGTLVRTGYKFAGWNTAANGSGTSYNAGATFAIATNTTLYAQWTSLSDVKPPKVTKFIMPPVSATRTVPIKKLTATDNVGVTGYLITESSTRPSATNPNWRTTKPTSHRFSGLGLKTAYAWAKDAAGNVSNGAEESVYIYRR